MCKPEIKILICNESFTCDMHYSFRYTIPDAFDEHEMSAEVTFRTKLKYPVIHLISREQCNWISTLMDGCHKICENAHLLFGEKWPSNF